VAHMLNTTAAVAPIVCKKTLLQNYNSLIARENVHTVIFILLVSSSLTCVSMKHKSNDKIWHALHLWPKQLNLSKSFVHILSDLCRVLYIPVLELSVGGRVT
jgi:hypothetical protein